MRPIKTTAGRGRSQHHKFVKAAQQEGHLLNSDYNGRVQDYVTCAPINYKGRRHGTTYLAAATGRKTWG